MIRTIPASIVILGLLVSCETLPTFTGFTYPDAKYKALILSYDDGTVHDIRVAALFDSNQLVGTFNLNSEYLGSTRSWGEKNGVAIYQQYVSRDTVNIIYKNHEVAAHGAFHMNFSDLNEKEVFEEVTRDTDNLMQLTGKTIKSMAYPFGNTNESIAKVVATTGLTNARTVANSNTYALPDNYFIWNPTCHDSKALELVNTYLALSEAKLSLFYVWGHSWEFDDPERWKDFTHFCHQVSGQESIWYVGSGEFIDYLMAIRKVKITDTEIINPQENLPVWVGLSSGFQVLQPGDRLRIQGSQ